MLPDHSLFNHANERFRYFVGGSDNSNRPSIVTDGNNLLLSQLSFVMAFACHRGCAPLVVHVRDIVGLCADKKMIDVYAKRIVAFVADILPTWDRTVCSHPRHAMGEPISLLPEKTTVSAFLASGPEKATGIGSGMLHNSSRSAMVDLIGKWRIFFIASVAPFWRLQVRAGRVLSAPFRLAMVA